ncbi:melanocortin-2 receptor accessory protein 2A-like [Solea solea]|uniref:melanocortin-2 receptor accessory protein 2A-like n=1 Tax=Solea solea TaxID=90069 RepID=UPI00272A0FA3|nr:melanocortin-2 receptor accessory protein 2A-like [Solea solea]
MSDFHNRSQTSARRGDYVWQYEYYDDEEPVSFEGLKAHRYSIVIGFWVGLAVFVIFMFFVLTLLTKTGAPHQENPDASEKRQQPGNCLGDIGGPQEENEKAFSRPLLAAPRSYFHFYISEEDQGEGKQKPEDKGAGKHTRAGAQQGNCSQPRGISCLGVDDMEEDVDEGGGHQSHKGLKGESQRDREHASLSHFSIPNFVNLEHSSTLGEDDLEYEHSRDVLCDIP